MSEQLARDITRSEQVEHELTAFVAKRDAQRVAEEGERPKEASYVPGLRRRDAARRQENLWAWLRHHERQLGSLTRTTALLGAHHRQEIKKYAQMLGLNHEGDDAA